MFVYKIWICFLAEFNGYIETYPPGKACLFVMDIDIWDDIAV